MTCQSCGYVLSIDANFCPKCGKPLKNRICSRCKKVNSFDTLFCVNCGAKLDTSDYTKKHKKKPEITITGSKKPALYLGTFIIISALLLFIFFKVNNIKWKANNSGNTIKLNVNNDLLNEIKILKERLRRNTKDIQANIRLGNIYFDIDNESEAIIHYRNALKMDSTNSDVRIDMAICYYELEDYQTAIKEIEKSLKFSPNHLKAFYNLGIINYSTGNTDKAIQWWKKLLAVEPQGELAEEVKKHLRDVEKL